MTGPTPAPDSPEQLGKTSRKHPAAFYWRRALLALIIVVLLAAIGGFAFMRYTRTNLKQALGLLSDAGHLVGDKIKKTPPFHGQKQVNILLLGTDVNFLDKSAAARSDTIKLISVDVDKPRIAVLSVPRDTWVEIPGHGHGKINGAYEHGGENESDRIALARTVIGGLLTDLSGEEIPIQYFVRIQTGGLIKIVDALGGVEVNVEKQMDYDDNYQNLYIHLKPGPQVLNGHEAMGYVRFRHDFEGDYGRMRRQDQFLRALFAEINKPEKREKLPQLIGPIMGMLKTNLSINDMLALKEIAHTLGKEAAAANASGQGAPPTDSTAGMPPTPHKSTSAMAGILTMQLPTVPTYKGKASVVEVKDPEAAALVISEVLHGPKPTVQVLNGTGKRGLGREVSEKIDAKAYHVVAVGTLAQKVDTSTVFAEPRFQQAAATLASTFNIQGVNTTDTAPVAIYGKDTPATPQPAITIIVGSDYLASGHTANATGL